MDIRAIKRRADELRRKIDAINRDGNIAGKYTLAGIRGLEFQQAPMRAELRKLQRILRQAKMGGIDLTG